MALLDTAKDVILSESLTKSGDDSSVHAKPTADTTKTKSAAIIDPSVNSTEGKNDVYTSKAHTSNTIEVKLAELKNKCETLGLNFEEVKKNFLQSSGYYETSNIKERLFILDWLCGYLNKFASLKNNKNIKMNNFKIAASFAKRASKFGMSYNDYSKYELNTGNVAAKCQNEKTDKAKQQRVYEERKQSKNRINRDRNKEINKCKNKDEINKVNRTYDSISELTELQGAAELSNMFGPQGARNAAYALSAENQAEGQRAIIESFEGEEREQVADSFTHEFEMQLLEDYYNYGEQISANEYEEIVFATTQYKSADAIEQYKADAEEYAQTHENTPWYTKEYAEAETRGIERGIQAGSIITNNKPVNTTAEQRDSVIYNNSSSKITEDSVVSANTPANRNSEESAASDNEILPKTQVYGTATQLEQALIKYDYSEVKDNFKNSKGEFMQLIAKSPELFHQRKHLLDYANTCSMEEFCFTIQKPNDKIEHYLLRTLSPENAGKYYDYSKKGMCYNERKYGEKVLEQNNTTTSRV